MKRCDHGQEQISSRIAKLGLLTHRLTPLSLIHDKVRDLQYTGNSSYMQSEI